MIRYLLELVLLGAVGGYGPNGTLSADEVVREGEKVVEKIEEALAADLGEAGRRCAQAVELEVERASASAVEADEDLEKRIGAHRRAEKVARRNATTRQEELETARAELHAAQTHVAGDACAESAAAAAEAKRRYDASSTTSALERVKGARTTRDALLARYRELVGDPFALPDGWVDDPLPPADAKERAKLLCSAFRPQAEQARSVEVGEERRLEHDRRSIAWVVGDSTGGLAKARQLPARLRAEAERAWHERHDRPRAEVLERLEAGTARRWREPAERA
jgi:hypothetical protein